MGYMPVAPSWRDDAGLASKSFYKRKFAIFPVDCTGGVRVWFKFYYKKFTVWKHSPSNKIFDDDVDYYHKDFNENITEEDYIVRKLAETL
jgi:hypothetical protein